jgi:BREX system ATP-binding protein BrxC/D
MESNALPIALHHAHWGPCVLERIEGTDWMVRITKFKLLCRITSSRRTEFRAEAAELPEAARPHGRVVSPTGVGRPKVHVGSPYVSAAPLAPEGRPSSVGGDRRILLSMIESLRNGLFPPDRMARELAVGVDGITRTIHDVLEGVAEEGGRAMVIRGAYGQGKTFALKLLEETSLEQGFMVAKVEIDSHQNRLTCPQMVVRELIRQLRLPGSGGQGPRALADHAAEFIRREGDKTMSPVARARSNYAWLLGELACSPLAWLLSDPKFSENKHLIGLLSCEPGVKAADARASHVLKLALNAWPSFNTGSQGDFGAFLLSGLGRLSRCLGYQGFVIILDEMEKWQDLKWKEQSRAGNLLGGLIWGATAEEGSRGKNDEPPLLEHSARSGGYPFTTRMRSHTGLAIAMTPRGEDGPERGWMNYGPLEIFDLPTLDGPRLAEYSRRVAPRFAAAYGLEPPGAEALDRVVGDAISQWTRQGDGSTRIGVQTVIAALDSWREGQ